MAAGNETYDVFVSYSHADRRHAVDIDSALRAKGLKPFLDRRNLAPGLPWVRAIEQAIQASRAAIVLIGPHGFGNTQQYERELALLRQSRDATFPVVPVLLPDTLDPPFTFLQVFTWIDLSQITRVSDAPLELERLVTAVRGGTISAEVRDAVCPYRGLDAFREEDSAFFFGRGRPDDPKSAIGELVLKAREHPFVMVVGRSGSGKSSLVNAGLLPALRRERDRFWSVLSLRPGPAPLRALAAAFNPRADEGAAEYATKITAEVERLRTGDPEILSHMVRDELDQAEGKPDRLLLFIDQWEELYAQGSSSGDVERTNQHAADVNRFIEAILTAARTAPVSVVGTVRADFYDPLISHQEIRSLLPTRQVLLGSISRAELERIIVEPARNVGLTFEPPGLVQRLLEETGEDEGSLPLLQYALKETWALRKGNAMTGDSYARSGGVREAIRITAERAYAALHAEDQQAARQLFLRLVTPGEGQEDTRARAEMPLQAAQLKIVEQFAGPRTRLLVTGWDRAKRPTVEVAHEALIRTWPRLRAWIDASREKLRARAAVLQSKTDWEQSGRRDDMLLPAGLQLERARTLVGDPGDTPIDDIKEFIRLSSTREEVSLKQIADAQRKRIRNRTIALVGVSALAVLAVSLGLVAEQQRIEAEEQRKQANEILAGATGIFSTSLEGGSQTQAWERAIEFFRRGAGLGDDFSMYMLGFAFQTGQGSVRDYEKARELYEKAAEKGNHLAMNQLGSLCENGWGGPQNYEKAREWYEKAANLGNAQSKRNIGYLYQSGFGVPQDYAKARDWFEKGANSGNAQAMGDLGFLYESGWSVPQDYDIAREWYEKSAAKDGYFAMSQLGFLYENGRGVSRDYVNARGWYEKAAEKGNDVAMNQLGWLYRNGWGVPQDYAKARDWFEKAAEKDNAEAINNLGGLDLNGWGVPQDYVKARTRFEKAAEWGSVNALSNLGDMDGNGLGGPKDYSKARGWYEKAAEKGHEYAMNQLGLYYQNAWGVPQDYVKAREWFEKAAREGNDFAMSQLGTYSEYAWGVPQDYVKAREWFENAARKGNDFAMTRLGAYYENAWGVPQDYIKAREWFENAARKGNDLAMNQLGVYYERAWGLPQDYAKAHQWFEMAAEKGNAEAMSNLGVLCANGWGVPQDYVKAREWFENAAKAGSAQAMNNLSRMYENGWGVPQDNLKGREWLEKAAGKGDESATAKIDELLVQEAASAGRYAEALRQQEAIADKEEATETKREGRPGKATANALSSVAWYALFAKNFTKALAASDRAHSIYPDSLAIETNRAHALMFLNRPEEARQLYLAHTGKTLSEQDDRLWQRVIADDFAQLREASLVNPLMTQIEKQFGPPP